MENRIPNDQHRLAAMFFAISNMGQPEPKRLDLIQVEFNALATDLEDGMEEEYQSWLLTARSGDKYMAQEWNEVIYPNLIKEKRSSFTTDRGCAEGDAQ